MQYALVYMHEPVSFNFLCPMFTGHLECLNNLPISFMKKAHLLRYVTSLPQPVHITSPSQPVHVTSPSQPACGPSF